MSAVRMRRILVAGMGNVLRRDDGFGVEVARLLAGRDDLPPHVDVIDVGIGGIHLVQRLMDRYDVLVVVDAIDRGAPAGTVKLLEAVVPDLSGWSEDERRDFLADMHYATPSRALILARALGVLPPRVYVLGCQAAEFSDLGIGLSEPVRRATGRAVREIDRIIREGTDGDAADSRGSESREGQGRSHSG